MAGEINDVDGFRLRVGTRRSALAMQQAQMVAKKLQSAGLSVSLVPIDAHGDIYPPDSTHREVAGVFTKALEEALLSKEIVLAVHSAKDVTTHIPAGLEILAYTEREASHDVFLGEKPFSPPCRIGTSSARRKAQLMHYFPSCEVVELRGNLPSRIKKMEQGDCDVLCLAYAGVKRLGYEKKIIKHLDMEHFVPPAGQGALIIEAVCGLPLSLKRLIVDALDHFPTRLCVMAERAFLHEMNAGCGTTFFALARISEKMVSLQAGYYEQSMRIAYHSTPEKEMIDTRRAQAMGEAAAQAILLSSGQKGKENIHL